MTGFLPYGGREIAELRATGKRPADMVLVSLVGPLRESNPVIVAKPDRHYDWRFLTDLEVLVVLRADVDVALARRVVTEISAEIPGYLGVWFADKQDGITVSWGSLRTKKNGLLRPFGAHVCQQFAGLGSGNYASH